MIFAITLHTIASFHASIHIMSFVLCLFGPPTPAPLLPSSKPHPPRPPLLFFPHPPHPTSLSPFPPQSLPIQVPPGGTNFQFRDPTEARHAVWLALTSSQNPQPLPQGGYALAIGTQTFCIGGAGIYTSPNMTGPWSYEGMLYTQLDYEPEVREGEVGAG